MSVLLMLRDFIRKSVKYFTGQLQNYFEHRFIFDTGLLKARNNSEQVGERGTGPSTFWGNKSILFINQQTGSSTFLRGGSITCTCTLKVGIDYKRIRPPPPPPFFYGIDKGNDILIKIKMFCQNILGQVWPSTLKNN